MLNLVVLALFIVVMFLFALIELRGKNRDMKSLIVSTGLLGTFAGVLLGLWDFDTARIEASVPLLLEGLKTAFITSVVGMALAILLGAYETIGAPDADRAQSGRDGSSELIAAIQHFETALIEQLDTRHTRLQQDLRHHFASLERTLADGASKAVVQALQQTMTDFNDRIDTAFGGNLKALQQAVNRLIDWQENYRRDIERFEQALALTAETARENAEETLELLRSTATENRAVLEALSSTLRTNTEQSLDAVHQAAQEVYRHFDELLKVQQQLGSLQQQTAQRTFETPRDETT